MPSTLSVIIATKDRQEDLRRFLESLNIQSILPEELTIIDASEQNFEKEYIKLTPPQIKFNYLQTAPGLTKQRNLGIQNSSGDILAFFDDDVILESNYLKILKESFEWHTEIGGFAGKITNLPYRKNWRYYAMQVLYYFLQLSYFDCKGRIRKSFFNNNYHLSDRAGYVQFTSGCAMAFTREALHIAGYFDEKLEAYAAMEDVDISYRVSCNHKIWYDPRARCAHYQSPVNRLKDAERNQMLIRNLKYLHQKNLPQTWDYLFALYWGIFGLLLVQLCHGNWQKAKGIWQGLTARQ